MHSSTFSNKYFYICIYSFRKGISIQDAAQNHSIPEATLSHKLSGYSTTQSAWKWHLKHYTTVLIEAEEQGIVNFITVL